MILSIGYYFLCPNYKLKFINLLRFFIILFEGKYKFEYKYVKIRIVETLLNIVLNIGFLMKIVIFLKDTQS